MTGNKQVEYAINRTYMPSIQKNTILSLICKKQPERLLFALVGDDRIELPTFCL